MSNKQPDNLSADIEAMQPYLQKTTSMMAGEDAMRAAGQVFLPKFEAEDANDYKLRLSTTPYENIFSDVVESLSSRPFSKQVTLRDAAQDIKDFSQNVDGAGTDLHKFAAQVFQGGVADSFHWIFVDKAQNGEGDTLDPSKRPYFVSIPAERIIAVHSDNFCGEEILTHFRYSETTSQADGFAETITERVRVYERSPLVNEEGVISGYSVPTFQVLERVTVEGGRQSEWVVTEEGVFGLPEIPAVPFLTGVRKGLSWCLNPPLKAAADLQVYHYQLGSMIQNQETMTAFTMAVFEGMSQPLDEAGKPIKVKLGAKQTAFIPPSVDGGPNGTLKWLHPEVAALQYLDARQEKIGDRIRELGRQPLTAGSGNITVIAAAFASQKANSAAQQWALNLQQSLSRALGFVAQFMGRDEQVEVVVHTDFDVGTDSTESDWLIAARERGDISREASNQEGVRRGWLAPEYQSDEDLNKLLEETPSDDEVGTVTFGSSSDPSNADEIGSSQ